MRHNHLLAFVGTILALTITVTSSVNAQTIKILGGNTLNGALNGTILGGATMALQNSNEFDPLRVGLGAGTLYGISVGIYDISQATKGQQYYVSATFNDGDNSTIIALLDTFYGAAGGAIVAASFNLIANEPIDQALQYGAGVGAWAGFGFGLIDAFLLAERAGDFQAAAATDSRSPVGGIITVNNPESGFHVGLLNPTLHHQTRITGRRLTISSEPAVTLVNLQIEL